MKNLLIKYRTYIIFIIITIVIIFFFLYRESKLQAELNNQRQEHRKQLIEERKKLQKEIYQVEQNALKLINYYKDKNEKRKEKFDEEPAQIIAPATNDDIINILRGARGKLQSRNK